LKTSSDSYIGRLTSCEGPTALRTPPLDILELVEPGAPLFPFFGWVEEFAQYPWFRVAGYQEMMLRAGITPRPKHISNLAEFAGEAKRRLPSTWQSVCPLDPDEWFDFSPKQINRISKNRPVRFDKACLAILALDLLHAHRDTGINIYNHVRIRPALFRLRGFDTTFFRAIRQTIDIVGMLYHAYQNDIILADEISLGYTVTHLTASRILEYLQQHGAAGDIEIERIVFRPTRTEYPDLEKHPAQREKAIIAVP
jgi:hypothetical protein